MFDILLVMSVCLRMLASCLVSMCLHVELVGLW